MNGILVCSVRNNIAVRKHLADTICSRLVFLMPPISVAALWIYKKKRNKQTVRPSVVHWQSSRRNNSLALRQNVWTHSMTKILHKWL
jgi:hypothetical protein